MISNTKKSSVENQNLYERKLYKVKITDSVYVVFFPKGFILKVN